ncbi:MAG: DUF4105 domain-containing protein [Polyangiaceae bacterium]|nr:DUF4105 domain-containing protein [Polyangiaceae bacterium]
MRRFFHILAVLAALILWPLPSLAGEPEIQIHLITMGAGDHIFTRAGHAAVMVAEVEGGAPKRTTVYNYGETDWENPYLVPQFLAGNLVFFLSESDGLFQTVNEYGARQGRAVYRQRLNLSPEQAKEVARRLKEGSIPGKREYIFHHSRAVCSTRITDLLDDVLNGHIRKELGSQLGTLTARDYQELITSGQYLISIGADLFVGRLHDRIFNKYEGTSYPDHMREYLQSVRVPAPSGGGELVPLAEAPATLAEVPSPPEIKKSRFTHYLWGVLILMLIGYGASAYRSAGAAPEEPAAVIMTAAIASGMVGLIITGFIVLSRVHEFRQNELILVFWPTDLWLAWRMRRLVKNKIALDAPVQIYAHARLGVAALAVLGHLTGVLYQRPLILFALGVVEAIMIWGLVRTLRAIRLRTP